MQPGSTLPNCEFQIDDIEEPWSWNRKFSLIFGRDLIFSIRDFPTLISQAYDTLKPGGWFELQSIILIPQTLSPTLQVIEFLEEFSNHIRNASNEFGTPVESPKYWKEQFSAQGFRGVTQTVHQIPCTFWPEDEYAKDLGVLEHTHWSDLRYIDGTVHRVLQRGLHWSDAQISLFVRNARELTLPQWRVYWEL